MEMMMAMLLVVLPVTLMMPVMIPKDSADTSEGSEVGGNDTSSAPAGVPEAKTDKALSDALKSLVDGNANEKIYARIPKVDSSKFIVDYKTVVTELGANYRRDPSDDKWVENSLGELKEFKNDSKKTVNYMVKEFEMKKSADQYARNLPLLRLELWTWVRFTLTSSMMTCSRK